MSILAVYQQRYSIPIDKGTDRIGKGEGKSRFGYSAHVRTRTNGEIEAGDIYG